MRRVRPRGSSTRLAVIQYEALLLIRALVMGNTRYAMHMNDAGLYRYFEWRLELERSGKTPIIRGQYVELAIDIVEALFMQAPMPSNPGDNVLAGYLARCVHGSSPGSAD